jgi:hypothetical protein
MSGLLPLATDLTRWWVSAYSRGLPEDERAARRAEIDSDLWEHTQFGAEAGQRPADTGFEVLTRLLLGIPADLAWRRALVHSASQQRPWTSQARRITTRGLKMARRLVTALAIIVTATSGLFLVYNGLGMLTDEGREAWMLRFGLWEASAGALLLLGLLATARWPRVGTILIAVGALVAVATHYWMAFIGVPLAVVIIAAAVIRARTIESRRLRGA